jgi:hypothetical protein
VTVEHRIHNRAPTEATVVISHPSFGTVTVKAKDISAGGISVRMGFHTCPPVGSIVNVVIKRHSGPINAEPLPMEVRHIQPGGIVGLRFV